MTLCAIVLYADMSLSGKRRSFCDFGMFFFYGNRFVLLLVKVRHQLRETLQAVKLTARSQILNGGSAKLLLYLRLNVLHNGLRMSEAPVVLQLWHQIKLLYFSCGHYAL